LLAASHDWGALEYIEAQLDKRRGEILARCICERQTCEYPVCDYRARLFTEAFGEGHRIID